MQNIRDALRYKLVNLTVKIDAMLLKQLTDEFGAEFEQAFYAHFYNSFQVRVGDEIQDNLKCDIALLITNQNHGRNKRQTAI